MPDDSPRMVQVWSEGQGLHWEEERRFDPTRPDFTDGDDPRPHWGDLHGVDG
jgi:hypothetical protein